MLIAGREVEGIGLGTAQFAFRDGTAEDSVATVHAALDAGVMLIDTALAYTRPGVESYAEEVVARALRGLAGERPLVAAKGGHCRDGDSFPVDGRPEALLRPARRPAHHLGLRRTERRVPGLRAVRRPVRAAPRGGAGHRQAARRVRPPRPARLVAGAVAGHRAARRGQQAGVDPRFGHPVRPHGS